MTVECPNKKDCPFCKAQALQNGVVTSGDRCGIVNLSVLTKMSLPMTLQLSSAQQEILSILQTHGRLSRSHITRYLSNPRSYRTLIRDLNKLVEQKS